MSQGRARQLGSGQFGPFRTNHAPACRAVLCARGRSVARLGSGLRSLRVPKRETRWRQLLPRESSRVACSIKRTEGKRKAHWCSSTAAPRPPRSPSRPRRPSLRPPPPAPRSRSRSRAPSHSPSRKRSLSPGRILLLLRSANGLRRSGYVFVVDGRGRTWMVDAVVPGGTDRCEGRLVAQRRAAGRRDGGGGWRRAPPSGCTLAVGGWWFVRHRSLF